jgi:hypothetical protein
MKKSHQLCKQAAFLDCDKRNTGSVHLRRQGQATEALVLAFDGSSGLAFAFGSGLFVKLTGAQFGQKTRLFDSALEATMATSNGSFSLTRMFGI